MVNSQLPNTTLTKFMITEISDCHPVNSTLNCHTSLEILERVEPLLKWIIAGRG